MIGFGGDPSFGMTFSIMQVSFKACRRAGVKLYAKTIFCMKTSICIIAYQKYALKATYKLNRINQSDCSPVNYLRPLFPPAFR